MRRRSRRWIVGVGCAGAALLGAAAAQAQTVQPRTSDEASQATLQGALLAPLRDLNLMRDKAPKSLTGAQEAPYLDPQKASCAELAAMIAPLEAALGPDRGDGAAAPKSGGRSMVLGALADITRDVIPFRGAVRWLTGASRQDQKVREGREAGQLRRAYLKGFASANGCYGPPLQVAQWDDPAPPPRPPVQVAQATPIAVATLPAPTAPEPPKPAVRFNLPESWRAQMAGDPS
ncbi:hypothetical protein [Phenylobacterium sp.]|uniref:hypothetical protein n=1 Tax=Phenylobacterium sp. TaxID=1871053 RepID=UPI002FCC59E7